MKKIIHVDMDCFYAAVEMREHPEWRGVPMAVGGKPEHRGVLSTCNYEARRFGLHSAMSSAKALRLCPDLVLVPGNRELYKEESEKIFRIFQDYTLQIEPISLDEAYLDVTGVTLCKGSATWMAKEIRERIFKERHLTASAGIAENKFLAKIASDWNKPNGQFTIPPERSATFAASLDIGKLPGVGKVSEKKLQEHGIFKCSDVLRFSLWELVKICGSFGVQLFQFAKGVDNRPVVAERVRKSFSMEDTFDKDLKSEEECVQKLKEVFERFYKSVITIKEDISKNGMYKSFVKIKYSDFSVTTIERSFSELKFENFLILFRERFSMREEKVRLLGLGIRLPEKEENPQLSLDFNVPF